MTPETDRCKTGIIMVGHCPLCVYPLSTQRHHVTKHPRPSPSGHAYCRWSESGCGDSLGTRL